LNPSSLFLKSADFGKAQYRFNEKVERMRKITKIGLWIFALTVFISVNAGCRESQQKSEPQPVKETAVAPAVGHDGPSFTIFGPHGVDPEPMLPETLQKIIETEEYGEVFHVLINLAYPGSPAAWISWVIRCPSCSPEATLVSYSTSRPYREMNWKRKEKEEALSRVKELLKKISEIPPDPFVRLEDSFRLKRSWGYSIHHSLSRFNVLVLFWRFEMSGNEVKRTEWGVPILKSFLDYTYSCDPKEKKCDEVWQTYKRLFLDEIRRKYPDIPPDRPLAGSTSEPSTP